MRAGPGPRRPSAAELYEDMHARILTGRWRPGEPLSEAGVAQEYGLSRTPIRQVFHRLIDVGFLVAVPAVGTYVAPIEVAAVRDAQFVRESLECRAVRRAARSTRPDRAALLEGPLAAQRSAIAAGDHLAFFQADEAWHRAIMAIAGHPHVWALIETAKVQLDRVRYLSLESRDWLQRMLDEHEAMLARILADDAQAAERLMRGHLRTAFAAIDRIAAEHAEFFATDRPWSACRPKRRAAPGGGDAPAPAEASDARALSKSR